MPDRFIILKRPCNQKDCKVYKFIEKQDQNDDIEECKNCQYNIGKLEKN